MILKTIRASIRLSSKLSLVQFINRGLVSTEHPHQIISRALSGWIVSAKEASAEQKYFEFFFVKSTQFAVDPPIIQSFLGQFGGIYVS